MVSIKYLHIAEIIALGIGTIFAWYQFFTRTTNLFLIAILFTIALVLTLAMFELKQRIY